MENIKVFPFRQWDSLAQLMQLTVRDWPERWDEDKPSDRRGSEFIITVKSFTTEGLLLLSDSPNTHFSCRGRVAMPWGSVFVQESCLHNRPPLHCGKSLTWSSCLAHWLGSVTMSVCLLRNVLTQESHAVVAPPLVLVSVTSLNSYNNVWGSTAKRGKSLDAAFLPTALLVIGSCRLSWGMLGIAMLTAEEMCVFMCLYGLLWIFLCLFICLEEAAGYRNKIWCQCEIFGMLALFQNV